MSIETIKKGNFDFDIVDYRENQNIKIEGELVVWEFKAHPKGRKIKRLQTIEVYF